MSHPFSLLNSNRISLARLWISFACGIVAVCAALLFKLAWPISAQTQLAVTASITQANLPAPSLTSPPNGGGNQLTKPTLIWSQVTGATSYRVMVAASQATLPRNVDADSCSGCVINTTTVSTFYILTQDLNPQTMYWWQVKARNATQFGEWSSQFSFTTGNICTRTPITLGRTVSGSLADSDCVAPHWAGRKADLYTFASSAGQRVTITLSSTAFDAYLVLFGPNDTKLDEDDDDGGGSNARISFTLPSAGTYTIEATSLTPSERGAYTLKLEEGICPASPISFDTPINGTLSNDDCNAPHRAGRRANRYTFTGVARQRVTITLSSNAFDAYLILVSPNNTVVAFNDDYGNGNDARINDFALPSTGTYTIEATSDAINGRGDYRLTLSRGSPDCTPVAITPDTPVNGSLSDGDCLAPHRTGRKADVYSFTGAAGQHVTITMNSTAFDSYLILVGPDNRVLRSNNGVGNDSRISNFALPRAGAYSIEATAFGSAERGAYTLTLNPRQTIFLVHGIGLEAADMVRLGGALVDPVYGVDTSRFKIDLGFDYGNDCAKPLNLINSCDQARCTIPNIAQRLAIHINNQNPKGDIIIIGYSLGGLVARDMLLNNYFNVVTNRRVAALITLGTPNAGYPYLEIDELRFCPTLVRAMDGNFRVPPPKEVEMSTYLTDLNTRWGSSSFPGKPRVWLAAAGTSCDNAVRQSPPDISDKGCPNGNRFSDGVVCDQSARFILDHFGNRPTHRWADRRYVHTDNPGSSFVLCAPRESTFPLYKPPADSDLIRKMKEVINGLTFTQGGTLAEPVDLSSRQEPFPVSQVSDDEALQFLRNALDHHLPEELKDDVYLLVRNRSSLAIPEMGQRLTSSLRDASAPTGYIYDLAEIIAYAANEEALDLLLRLAKLEHERFGPFLARLLNYAHDRRNPYLLVYRALGSTNPEAESYLLEWVEKEASTMQGQQNWAEALMDLNNGASTEGQLLSDPILSRLPEEKSLRLRKKLSRLTQDVIQHRNQN